MKVAIVGSRGILDPNLVEQCIKDGPFDDIDLIISGGADGVDTSAEMVAQRLDIDMKIIEPDYSDWSGNEHPAKRRNTTIVEKSDAVIAVWDGRSNGTRDTIDKALDRGVPIYVEVVK